MEILKKIAKTLENGEDEKIVALVQNALSQGIKPQEILSQGLIAGMEATGKRFKCREFFLPDVLLAAKCMNMALDELKPLLVGEKQVSRGKIVLGTVQGDMHDIGKNLVGIMLKGAGFEVIDLGSDVPCEKFVEAVKEEKAKVLGLSALLITTMPMMKRITQMVRADQACSDVKIILGGAPITEDFVKEIGADAYGYDAANAVEKVSSFFGKP